MSFQQFDRGLLRLKPLAERVHDVNRSAMVYPQGPRQPFDHPALGPLAEQIEVAAKAGRTILLACGRTCSARGTGHS